MRSPIFVGGGRVFGPTPERNYHLKVNKKVRKNALFTALSALAASQAVLVKDIMMTKPSTRDMLVELTKEKLNALNYVLIVSNDENVYLSARNLPNVEVTKVTSLSVESLVRADALVISKESIE